VRIKGDERILGDTDFVKAVLKEADKRLERRYRLKAEGFDLEQVRTVCSAIGPQRDRNEHDGFCQALKSYPAGSQHCSAAGGKVRPRKSI
jgi:hypothetical protein